MSTTIYFQIDLEEQRVVEGIAPYCEMGEPRIETVRFAEPPYDAKIRALDLFRDGNLPDIRIDDFYLLNPDPKLDRQSVQGMELPTILSRALGDADVGHVDLTDLYLNDLLDFLRLTAPSEIPAWGCITMDDEGRFLGLQWSPERPMAHALFSESVLSPRLLLTCEFTEQSGSAQELITERQEWIQKVESEAAERGVELHDHLVLLHKGTETPKLLVSLRSHQGARGWWK